MGGKYLLRLNIDPSPIAHKYREGKVKRTLKRELKVPETVGREADATSAGISTLPAPKGMCCWLSVSESSALTWLRWVFVLVGVNINLGRVKTVFGRYCSFG